MTLNMPSLLNSFPTSAAAGEGFESQYVEKFFLEATGLVPIGSIVAWAKSFAGVPALAVDTLFVECNGQVLADAASLLDGQTMPDLNVTKRFLRGSATSGTTAGADTHAHAVYGLENVGEQGHSAGRLVTNVTGATNVYQPTTNPILSSAGSTLPAHYEIVWLIRVK